MKVHRLPERKSKFVLLRRMVAAYIDMALPVLAIIGLGIGVKQVFANVEDASLMLVLFPLGFVGIICKDLLRPSIGKRIMGLTIVSEKGRRISEWTLVRRNLSMGMWGFDFPELVRTNGAQKSADRELGLKVVDR